MASNNIGIGIEKTQETINKINSITQEIDKVNKYLVLGSTAAQSIRTLINGTDEEIADAKKELKAQAKERGYAYIKEKIPTEDEIIEFILKKSCDVQIMNIVKDKKNEFEKLHLKLKDILDTTLTKFNKLKKKTDKILETLTNITTLLIIFQALIAALELLILAAKISLLALTGIFASGAATVRIKEAIEKADSLISEYTGAIKTFAFYAMKTINGIISIINFIPILINLFENLKLLLDDFIKKVLSNYEKYIRKCLGDEGFNNDGTLDVESIDKHLDFDTSNLSNLDTDILGDYIRDNDERRIFRPKIN
tara:strand:- start:10 stop:939 length:930 start_codon:yes stop_codon:yes gene_type:complete